MNRDLDEIEAELKGVSVKYRCDHADRCDRHLGKCIAREPHLLHPECATRPEKCPTTEWQVKCIPVEPERVKWYYRMSCATRACAANDEGMCNVSINGLATCSKHQWPKPSPGLLQRMGMCVWETEDIGVFFVWPAGKHLFVLADGGWTGLPDMDQDEADRIQREFPTARMFRWQDGVQG